MSDRSFYEIHFTGEGFRTLAIYRLFFRAALQRALKARADYAADVRDWYENGDGRPAKWVEVWTETDTGPWPEQVNEGGKGHTYPSCPHGMSYWTDYDNICGGCEDGQTAIQEAIVAAREAFLRFNKAWEWMQSAPAGIPQDVRDAIMTHTISLFPGRG